jgi:predicted DNA-binding transcriptional regulator AlpA
MVPHGDGDRLLTKSEVGLLLNLSVPSVKRWKREGKLPSSVTIGARGVRWWLSDILRWIDERQVKPTQVK